MMWPKQWQEPCLSWTFVLATGSQEAIAGQLVSSI